MTAGADRTVSGRALVIAAAAVVVAVTAASQIFGPDLREQVLQEQQPRTLREPIATGRHDGQVWEAIARFDGTANCVELRYRAEVLDRACDTGPPRQTTRIPAGGPAVVYGTADEDADHVVLQLADGQQLDVPVRAGELGFPVGFWATELPAGAELAGS
ncbi:MAG TPA: hypothetical protein VM307_00435 [Egibacteraceae bacterium]|nr:hypothetical protein [Egibacteraceae bacterium]